MDWSGPCATQFLVALASTSSVTPTILLLTGKSKHLLEENVRPAVEEFLAERGLTLSAEKTAITHIKNGFTFLGQTFRKRGNVLHITPSIEGVLALKQKLGDTIREYVSAPMPALIKKPASRVTVQER